MVLGEMTRQGDVGFSAKNKGRRDFIVVRHRDVFARALFDYITKLRKGG